MVARLTQLAKESAVYGLSTIITRLVAIFLVPLYTRIFSPEDYGILAMVTTIIIVVGIFVGLGAEAGFTIGFFEDEDVNRRSILIFNYVVVQVVTAVILAGALFAVSSEVAASFLGSSDRNIYIEMAAMIIVGNCLNQVAFNLFRNARKPWTLVLLNTGVSLLQVFLSIIFVVWLGYGLIGSFAAQLIAAVVFLLASIWLMRDWLRAGRVVIPVILPMVRLGFPYMLTALSLQFILLADRFFIEYFHGLGAVGVYSIGVSLASALGFLTGAFQMAFGPYAMSIQHQMDARATYANILTVFYAMTAGCAILVSLFARECLLVFATEQYYDARTVVPYLAFYVVMVSLSYIASLGSWIAKRTDNLAWTTLIGAVVNVALNIVLVPSLGMVGAGIATAVAQLAYVCLLFWASQRCYHIPYRWHDVFWISVLSVLAIVLGSFADQLPLLSGVLVKALIASVFPVGLVLTGIAGSLVALRLIEADEVSQELTAGSRIRVR
jgi:O-antigen/teichoic acid export membrane protein